MKRTIVALIILAIIGIGGWFIFLRGEEDTPTPSSAPTTTSPSSPDDSNQTDTSDDSVDSVEVEIDDFAFTPAELTIKKGATVTWTNKDSTGHTVTETDNQTGPNSTTLQEGETYSFTFNTVGTFRYGCSIHPEMTGTITVTE